MGVGRKLQGRPAVTATLNASQQQAGPPSLCWRRETDRFRLCSLGRAFAGALSDDHDDSESALATCLVSTSEEQLMLASRSLFHFQLEVNASAGGRGGLRSQLHLQIAKVGSCDGDIAAEIAKAVDIDREIDFVSARRADCL